MKNLLVRVVMFWMVAILILFHPDKDQPVTLEDLGGMILFVIIYIEHRGPSQKE